MSHAVIGLFRCRMDLGYFTENVIHYSDNPGFYLFCVITLFVLGVGVSLWGMAKGEAWGVIKKPIDTDIF